jgi:hypothetical protein
MDFLKKNLEVSPQNIIFEVLEVERAKSQFFMTDSFFQSKNTHSVQISRF